MSYRPQFSQPRDEYVVLKLSLDKFAGNCSVPPDHGEIVGFERKPDLRSEERRLLRMNFDHWELPFYGKLPGWREDSPVYMMWDQRLVGGLYLCTQNEFEHSENWGQLHYFFVDPQFRGRHLHSLLFREAVLRARAWGLDGVYINTDRHLLPELYQRWGAVIWKRIPKQVVAPRHANIGHHNWLVYRIHDERLLEYVRRYAAGVLADIGCGAKPYAESTKGIVTKHIGIDHVETGHAKAGIDVFASAYDTTLASESVDTVLCTAVLEHLERPEDALTEMHRILKEGGYVIASAPLFWHIHEEPRDFYRYTRFGLLYLFTHAGFEVIELSPLSGFLVTFAQELCYYLSRFKGPIWSVPVRLAQSVLQQVAYRLHRTGKDRNDEFTWAYIVVAKKVKNG